MYLIKRDFKASTFKQERLSERRRAVIVDIAVMASSIACLYVVIHLLALFVR